MNTIDQIRPSQTNLTVHQLLERINHSLEIVTSLRTLIKQSGDDEERATLELLLEEQESKLLSYQAELDTRDKNALPWLLNQFEIADQARAQYGR